MRPTFEVFASFVFLTVIASQSGVTQDLTRFSPALEDLRALYPPDAVSGAADVRWQTDGSLLFGLRHDGIYSWRPGANHADAVATLSGTTHRRAGRYGNYSRLGGGPTSNLVFAGDLFGLYRQRDGRITALKANVEIVGDLDHRNGTVVAVGLARQPKPSPGPDDVWEPYIAWLIDAEGGVRGLLPTRDGGAALDSCYPVELSVSRFVADDLILVIPGAEPGAFLYGTDGMLRQTVDLGAFSTSRPDCGPEQKPLLYKEEFRTAWLSRHRVIDEVAANGDGDVFFFVRYVADDEPVSPVPTSGRSEGARVVGHRVVGAVPGVQGADAEEIVGSKGIAGSESGRPTVVAFGLGSLPASELDKLLQDAASQGGTVTLTGEHAARLLAAANVQADVGETSLPSSSRASSAPKARVCWDIVHARTDDLRSMSTAPCAVTSDLADARLRVDLSGDRAVFLIRGATRLASGDVARPAEVFEARLRAGS